ncbi:MULTISPECIES: septation protein SepH [unclassified Corynebacterium]|uniref:septation protein SepH n=1 Tax=unclassified Corynebacterium TaxID=2624378 RepID=UPI00352671A3
MRELRIVPEESTPGSLVLHLVDPVSGTAEDEQFFLTVDDRLRGIITGDAATPAAESAMSTDTDGDPAASRTSREPDPRLSAPLTMSPKEIQARIRGGAEISELATECGVPESRIEPFAHPVLLERGRIADMAKQAHPVRDDGPAPLTLWEVLATALAARGYDLDSSEWDSYRESGGQWVILVTWLEGQTRTTSEWSYHRQGVSNATAVARNSVAAALLDPNFGRPKRILSPVWAGTDTAQDDDRTGEHGSSHTAPGDSGHDAEDHLGDGGDRDFLRHPDDEQSKRPRRRAITPHWEDVLLGVRTNTKRPKN